MATEPKKEATEEEEGGEFAEFLADVSQEIAQRVESLGAGAKPRAEEKKKTPVAADAGLIAEWPNIADRIIEEMR
ncbi:MAG TPA: hypothetical protein VF858_04100 [Gemmatimonadaceae bacterium]